MFNKKWLVSNNDGPNYHINMYEKTYVIQLTTQPFPMNLGGYALGMVPFTANSTALYHFVSIVGGTTVAVHFN